MVRGFVDKLEQVSKDPSLKEEMEAEVLSTNSNSGLSAKATSWASWAVGALGAKFYKGATPPPQQPQQQQENSKPKSRPESKSEGTRSTDFSASEGGSMASEEVPVEKEEEEGNGWGDEEEDWGSLEVVLRNLR